MNSLFLTESKDKLKNVIYWSLLSYPYQQELIEKLQSLEREIENKWIEIEKQKDIASIDKWLLFMHYYQEAEFEDAYGDLEWDKYWSIVICALSYDEGICYMYGPERLLHIG